MWDRLEMYIDIYDNNDKIPYQVWIWKKENIYQQIKEAYKNNPNMKFIPNMSWLKSDHASTWTENENQYNWNNSVKSGRNQHSNFFISNFRGAIWELIKGLLSLSGDYFSLLQS